MPPIIVTVPSLPTSTGKIALSEQATPHTEYTFQTFYLDCEGIVPQPVAGPAGTPCEFVQWSAPFGMKMVVWQASRIGAQPAYPDMLPKDSAQERLLDWKFGPCVPTLMPDGRTYEYVASGIYLYGLRVPPTKSAGMSLGSSPANIDAATAFAARSSNFRQAF